MRIKRELFEQGVLVHTQLGNSFDLTSYPLRGEIAARLLTEGQIWVNDKSEKDEIYNPEGRPNVALVKTIILEPGEMEFLTRYAQAIASASHATQGSPGKEPVH